MGIDVSVLDGVIKKTIKAVESSKEQIFEIAETARHEYQNIQQELQEVRDTIGEVISQVDELDLKYRQARSSLMMVSRDFNSYTEDDIRVAYETAHDVQIDLLLAREKETNLRKRRDDLERRLRNLGQTIEKAENLMSQMGIVLSYLMGDLGQVEEMLATAKQHQMMGLKIIQAQEEERKRVAREIHDGPAQSMANVVLRADLAEKMLKNQQVGEALQELQGLKEMVRLSLADVRRIIFDLRPMALDDLGLVPTLQKYIQTFEERTELHIELTVFGKEQSLESSFKAGMFRLVQECLTNVAKHARARFVQVKLEFQPEMLYLVVKDDGVGFSVEKIQRSGHSFGILGMRERTQLLQGKMEITSAPQQGAKVFFQIPLKGD
ncbi:sensor histidine kinase [Brevibacillus humidisoli]|uniref:sensor histidine kinase n=1 Tax=Brevibacillus humidisoli TaxID=2895522 RepID=UPI001E53D954|nr:sensor histidine kinase [Brevibacillus humidisoli]UFJ40068.1 sensor histidine kinase [Brevibacillus humidisoli]